MREGENNNNNDSNDQQEHQYEAIPFEEALLQSNEAYMNEQQIIMDHHQHEEPFREETAAILTVLSSITDDNLLPPPEMVPPDCHDQNDDDCQPSSSSGLLPSTLSTNCSIGQPSLMLPSIPQEEVLPIDNNGEAIGEPAEEPLEQQSIISSPPPSSSRHRSVLSTTAQLTRWRDRKGFSNNSSNSIHQRSDYSPSSSTSTVTRIGGNPNDHHNDEDEYIVVPGAVQQNYPAEYRNEYWDYQRRQRENDGEVPTFGSPTYMNRNTSRQWGSSLSFGLLGGSELLSDPRNGEQYVPKSKCLTIIILGVAIGLASFLILGLSIGLNVGKSKTCHVEIYNVCQQEQEQQQQQGKIRNNGPTFSGTFHVPDCARAAYQEYGLTLMPFLLEDEQQPSSSLFLAGINKTTEPQPCEPSLLALLSLAVTTVNNPSTQQQEQQYRDYIALASIFFSTGGPRWYVHDQWLANLNVCTWFGVTCSSSLSNNSSSTNVTTGLELIGNNLVGSLPTEIGLLKNLTSLDVRNDLIGGSIPTEIGALHQLSLVALRIDNVGGHIPTEIGNCRYLESLHIASNRLSGSIPSEIGRLQHVLKKLELLAENLSGTLPSELGNLKQLTTLDLNANGISGTFPSEIGKLTMLENLIVVSPQVEGKEFWTHLYGLSNLLRLRAQIRVASTFPTTISKFSSLKALNLERNFLGGPLPTELGRMTQLTLLSLSYQPFLRGQLPTEIGRLTRLSNLVIQETNLSGRLPSELGHLTALSTLSLTESRFHGTLPSELCFFHSIPSFQLHFCKSSSSSTERCIVEHCS